MPSNKASLMHRLASQGRLALANDAEFCKAINDGDKQAACSVAVNLVLELVQQQAPKGHHGSAASKPLDPSSMLALLNIGDEVRKQKPCKDGQHLIDATGDIVEVAQHALDKAPTYTVRWRDSTTTKETYEQLTVTKRRDLPIERLAGRLSTTGAPTAHKAQPSAALLDLRAALLKLEDRLPWTYVTRAFAGSRGSWRKDLGHAVTLRQFVRSYRDFLPFLKIDQHMPSVELHCNTAATLDTMQHCADSQDAAGMQEVWEKQVMPDFAMWQATASSRQRPAHIHTGRAAHVLESIGSEDEAACVAEIPWGVIMTQEQLAALRVNFQRELEFCDRKAKDLKALVKAEAPLTDAAMAGVTYGSHGLGGCYGGAPRARPSMLDGVWDCRSDVETELDTGSEATDLADSWLLEGEHDAQSPETDGVGARDAGGAGGAAAAQAESTGAVDTAAPGEQGPGGEGGGADAMDVD